MSSLINAADFPMLNLGESRSITVYQYMICKYITIVEYIINQASFSKIVMVRFNPGHRILTGEYI